LLIEVKTTAKEFGKTTSNVYGQYLDKAKSLNFIPTLAAVKARIECKVMVISRGRFREMKNRTKRFYNNVNSKTLKSLEELVTAIAAMHNIIRAKGGEVIPT
jgi:hypothetical protein